MSKKIIMDRSIQEICVADFQEMIEEYMVNSKPDDELPRWYMHKQNLNTIKCLDNHYSVPLHLVVNKPLLWNNFMYFEVSFIEYMNEIRFGTDDYMVEIEFLK